MRLGALGLELFELGFWLKNVQMPAVFRPLAFWLLKVDVLAFYRQFVDPTQSGTFHCVNRCVRRSWLWGLDKYLGKSFEHRKSWVEARILELGQIFALRCSSLGGYEQPPAYRRAHETAGGRSRGKQPQSQLLCSGAFPQR